MYTKSPPLTRANLNRSQSVYAKSPNPRDILPKPGPLIPFHSELKLKEGFLNANIREFGSPNFIAGVKSTQGNVVKVPQMNYGTNFNQNTLNFLAGRNPGSKSCHDMTETVEKPNFVPQFNGNHVTNQNVQNQHLQSLKPEKPVMENIYGVRNSPTGGIYPEPRRPEIPGQRDNYELIPRSQEKRTDTPRSQNTNFNRTAAYVQSVQNSTGFKTRESNYDIVPSGIREVSTNPNQKPHNRSETSDYGSNRSDTSIYGLNRSGDAEQQSSKKQEAKKHERPERPELPLPPPDEVKNENRSNPPQKPNFSYGPNGPNSLQHFHQQLRSLHMGHKPMMPEPNCNGNPQLATNFLNQRNESRQSPLSSVSSNSFTRNSPNPPY